ncbi:MAG: signal peptide peptidase SppA [Candidatus Micrarchaeota archaeon]
MAEKKDSGLPPRRRSPIELPSSPLWGYGLLALIALFVALGILLIFGSSSQELNLPGGCVGLVHIDGEIMAQDTPASLLSSGSAGSEEIANEIYDADNRGDVKAILLQINSPGGSVVGSNEIYRAVKNAKKPVVAYFREIAASGGYEAGVGADYIISEPDALTGSIGAKMTLSQLSGLFEKVGYNETTIKSGELKDIGNPARDITDKEKEVLQSIVDEAYSEFESTVIENRAGKLDMGLFYQNVADARVLTGRQAYRIGLVDEVGSKKDAIAKASDMGGSNTPLEVCEMGQKSTGLFGNLFSGAFDIVPFMKKESASLSYK